MEKILEEIIQELKSFFNFKAEPPLLFLIDNRKDMNLIWGKKTEDWFVGAFKHGNIYILNPEIFEKESSHRREEFAQILKHEYCHVYYTQLTNGHCPSWLNEGLACFLSGKKLILKDGYKDKLLNIFSYFKNLNADVYMIGQYWVQFLLKKFGKKKFISLIKAMRLISNEQQFNDKFYEIYNFKFDHSSFSKFIE
ncbi:MAG: hypothetical protein WC415_03115 [Patescibacteria group bacterium]